MDERAGDTVSVTADTAGNMTVGKNNVQQVVTVGHEDDEHTSTIKLVYELVSTLTHQIDRERAERHQVMDELRRDVAGLQKITHETQVQVATVVDVVGKISNSFSTAVVMTDRHRFAFMAAFAVLFMPVPLFYSPVRDLVAIGWQSALVLAASAYVISAILWSYMWWGR